MKKIGLVFILLTLFLGIDVFADEKNYLNIIGPSSVYKDAKYEVTIKYNGVKLGSSTGTVRYNNAVCEGVTLNPSVLVNCRNGMCEFSFNIVGGLPGGSNIMKLTCASYSLGKASFTTSSDDAYKEDGIESVSIYGDSKEITISEEVKTTTTSTTTTTTTTTTKQSQKPNNSTTTTSKITSGTTTSSTTTTSAVIIENPNEITTSYVDTTTTAKIDVLPEDNSLTLKNFKVVGYEIKKIKNNDYNLSIPKSVNEIYIIADSINDGTIINGAGLINITNKDKVIVEVKNGNKTIDYLINIKRTNNNSKIYLLIIVLLIIINIILSIFAFKKSKKIKQ